MPLRRGGQSALSIASLISGIGGVLTLRVLFPDASVALGFLAIVAGLLVLLRAGKERSRIPAAIGVLLGSVVITIAIVSVVAS